MKRKDGLSPVQLESNKEQTVPAPSDMALVVPRSETVYRFKKTSRTS